MKRIMQLTILVILALAIPVIGFSADSAVTATSDTELFGIFKAVVPNVSTGLFYSVDQKQLSTITCGSLASKETSIGTFNLDAGYGSSELAVGAITYTTATIERLGVKVPILKEIFAKIGYGAGIDGIGTGEHRFVNGPQVTLGASIKF